VETVVVLARIGGAELAALIGGLVFVLLMAVPAVRRSAKEGPSAVNQTGGWRRLPYRSRRG
jgi:hypothetical protein